MRAGGTEANCCALATASSALGRAQGMASGGRCAACGLPSPAARPSWGLQRRGVRISMPAISQAGCSRDPGGASMSPGKGMAIFEADIRPRPALVHQQVAFETP